MEGFAIASLALAVAGLFMLPIIGGVLGVVFGATAKRRIQENPQLEGDSMARAGVIVGWVGIAFWVLIIVLIVLAITSGTFDAEIRRREFRITPPPHRF